MYVDRVKATIEAQRRPALLAHVLAHEITHILQGRQRHSDSGLMKAHWGGEDYRQMASKTLTFTAEDIQMIYDGMGQRATAATLAAYRSETERPAGEPVLQAQVIQSYSRR